MEMNPEISSDVRGPGIRWGSLVLLGIMAVIFGVLILLYPQISALILVEIIGIFIVLISFGAIMLSAFARGGKGAVLIAVIGIIGFFFGIATILSPVVMGTVIFELVGIALFIIGVIDLVFAATEKYMAHRGLFALQGIVSVILGLSIIILPLIGGAIAVVIIAAYFVFWGIVSMILGYSFRSALS